MAGYAKISRIYLWAFLSYASFQVLLAQVLWHYYVRSFWGKFCLWELSTLELSCIVMVTSGILLVAGHYRLLDGLTKWDYRPADSSDGCSCIYRCR